MQREKVDLIIKNAMVFNSYFKKFYKKDVAIKEGKFYYLGDVLKELYSDNEIDATGKYLIPGLIDIHMHIESSMLTPHAFAMHLAKCAVTTVVTEPHELANVAGVKGIIDMMEAGKNSPVDMFYAIPSCVPAARSDLETTGGVILASDMMEMYKHPMAVCVGEVMNYRSIIEEGDNSEITKFLKELKKIDKHFPVEGHCPSLVDLDLAKFLFLGINSDHTEHTMEETKQRFENGMFMQIQDKMLTKEVIDYIMENNLYEHFSFVTDDCMADTFLHEGHLNILVKDAIKLGMSPENAIYCASFTPARRMNFTDRGAVAPGKIADFVLLDDLNEFIIDKVYKDGKIVNNMNEDIGQTFSSEYYNTVKLDKVTEDTFKIKIDTNKETVTVRVIEVSDTTTRTLEKHVEMPVENGYLKWENSGCMLTCVFDRYTSSGRIGFGFITGDSHKNGAIATTYAHDNHNLLVAGANTLDMMVAANRVIELQGAYLTAENGEITAELPLSVGGILSDKSVEFTGLALEKVRAEMHRLGYKHYNPIMSFGVLPLSVSPAIKITDMGIIDVVNTKVLPLIVE